MSQGPKLSVAMTTYNHERYITRAVESALAQETGFNVEIVIGDDCSTDGTRQILADLKQKHPDRIRLLLHETNLGSVRNFVTTLSACRGEYIAILEGDDFWTSPSKLQRQVEFLDQHPECVICCHRVKYVDPDGAELGTTYPETAKPISTIDDLIETNFIQTCSVVLRGGVTGKIPRWFRTLGLGDYPLFLMYAEGGKIGFLDEVWAAYRIHPNSLWSSKPETYRHKQLIRMFRFLRRDLPRQHRAHIDRILAIIHLLIYTDALKERRYRRAYRHRYLAFLHGGWAGTKHILPTKTLVNLSLRRVPILHRLALWSHDTYIRAKRIRPTITGAFKFGFYILRTELLHPGVVMRGMSRVRNQGVDGVRNELKFLEYYFRHRQSVYQMWARQHDTLTEDDRTAIRACVAQLADKPLISVLMPVYNVSEEYLRKAIESVRSQLYPHWELCIADDASPQPHVRRVLEEYQRDDPRIRCVFRQTNGHISAASNSALELVTGEFVALLDHDDELPQHALYMVAEEINRHPDVNVIYSDEDKIDTRGRRFDPYFKTGWNPDLFLSHNMVSHLGVYRASLMREVGGFREGYEGSQDYDLALRLTERSKPSHVRHIPHVLYHWRATPGSVTQNLGTERAAYASGLRAIRSHFARMGIRARVEFNSRRFYRVHYELPEDLPLVSVVIPTKDQVAFLRRTVDGVLQQTEYPKLEVIIVDNRSTEPETKAYLQAMAGDPRVRVLSYDRPFNYSAINNMAVREAAGPLICLLNNDVEVAHPDWLREMVSHALRPEVGAVGAKLYYPNNTIQHSGVLLGCGGVAGHAHSRMPRDVAVSFARTDLIQSFSAVTAGCMVLRKAVYEEVGGFDEKEFAVRFNDVDFCLRIVDRGYWIVWTPYAELYHYESASIGYSTRPEQHERDHLEVERMKRRWGDRLLNDPFLNPNYSLDRVDYALAFPPRAKAVEANASRPGGVILNSTPAPEVSVVLPVYNAERYLGETIASILSQTFREFELIAVDDGSSDGSVRVLAEFQKADDRVRILERPHAGIVAARNDGMDVARGEYIACMDHDDVMMPDRFEMQVAFLRKHPECIAVGGNGLLIDPDGDALIERCPPTDPHEIEAQLLNGINPIIQPSVMIRRKSLVAVGGYREQCNFAEDYDLFLRLSELGQLANIPRVFVKYRQHMSRASHSHFDQQNKVALAALAEAYQRRGMKNVTLPEIRSWHPNSLAGFHVRCANDALDGGHLSTARKHAAALFRKRPWSPRAWDLLARTHLGTGSYGIIRGIKAILRPLKRST